MNRSELANLTAFVEIANHADQPVRVPTRLVADGAPLDERQIDIPARTRTRLSIPLPADAHPFVSRTHPRRNISGRDRTTATRSW